MRRIISHSLIAIVMGTLAGPILAKDKFELVEERIRELAPSAKSIAVSETRVEGILQVQVEGDIVYATDDGRYLFQGRVIDMETREDLTETAKADMRKVLLDDIDESRQIDFVPEQTTYDLTVFTDIDCGYCRKLHSQMAEYNDQGIAIHYMAFPRAGIGSASYDKFVSVWCADDQQAALTQAKAGEEPEPKQCENPIAEQYQLGIALGVTGTPAIMTRDGQLIPGYVPPETLKERLDSMAAPAASK
ncbi:MAG TPA: DsbC family protein [Xanthomonadales bacterium]|nr:DsbC family protein [Xanthomonadales bacterium]